MFVNVPTGHPTNLRTPNLILLVSLTSHCCVGSVDDIGYSALRSVVCMALFVSGFMKCDS
jgi:hypothetical protein